MYVFVVTDVGNYCNRDFWNGWIMNELEQLKTAILEMKMQQNEKHRKYFKSPSHASYYMGYMSALNTVEGAIAEIEYKGISNG